jgi:hypothetical protein
MEMATYCIGGNADRKVELIKMHRTYAILRRCITSYSGHGPPHEVAKESRLHDNSYIRP